MLEVFSQLIIANWFFSPVYRCLFVFMGAGVVICGASLQCSSKMVETAVSPPILFGNADAKFLATDWHFVFFDITLCFENKKRGVCIRN